MRHRNAVWALSSLLIGLGTAAPLRATADGAAADLRKAPRLVVYSAPSPDDSSFLAQHKILAEWRGGEERDVKTIGIAGDVVTGSADGAAQLRRKYQLPADRFTVALIGKDGRIKLRSPNPLSGGALAATIDAMPMRRNGQR